MTTFDFDVSFILARHDSAIQLLLVKLQFSFAEYYHALSRFDIG